MPLQQDLVESSCVLDKEETKDIYSLDSFAHLRKKLCGDSNGACGFFCVEHIYSTIMEILLNKSHIVPRKTLKH